MKHKTSMTYSSVRNLKPHKNAYIYDHSQKYKKLQGASYIK